MMKLLKPYLGFVTVMVLLALGQQGLSLFVPKVISRSIDAYASGTFVLPVTIWQFAALATGIFVTGAVLAVVQTVVGEKVAKDLRTQLADKVSRQDFLYVQQKSSAVLLTNFSSDVDAVKMFVSQGVSTVLSSLFVILGAAVFLLLINWRLGLAVLVMVPLIGVTMMAVFSQLGPLFKRGQQVIDRLNAVINENILGAAFIRVVHAQAVEYQRFLQVNGEAKEVGMGILRMFASLIPLITLIANAASLVMVLLGGRYIMNGTLSVGDFAAFMSYLGILIFPIFMLGFMSNMIGRSAASYARLEEVLNAPVGEEGGSAQPAAGADIVVDHVSLAYAGKTVVKDASFVVQPGSRTAIIGPTAAGKTQLMYLLSGLTVPEQGHILYGGQSLTAYNQTALRKELGIVFQDSVLFNMTLRENIAFGQDVTEEDVQRAIATAELDDFLATLPEGLATVVSERGTSLSGGQKQRVMLARALAHNPSVLLLDDFTARVDVRTEQKILANIAQNYPGLTLISVTQKVATAEEYDQIIVLMEGEVLATGTHRTLLETSPEYVQIVDSQRSTHIYEVQPE